MGSPNMRTLGMAALPPAHISIPLGLHPGSVVGVSLQLQHSMLLQTHGGFDGRQLSKELVETSRRVGMKFGLCSLPAALPLCGVPPGMSLKYLL